MALFGETFAREVTSLVERRHGELGAALGVQPEQAVQAALDEQTPLRRDLKLLIAVANGELMRTDAAVRRVELALGRVMDLLLGNALGSNTTLPDDLFSFTPPAGAEVFEQ